MHPIDIDDNKTKKLNMPIIDTGHFSQIILIVVLIIAAISDIRFQKIPNWLTFPAMLAAVVINTSSMGLQGFLFSFGGILVGIAAMIIPYLMGGMGAGDAKLMGAVGGMLGPKGVFIAFLLTALIGGLYALGILAYCGGLGETVLRYWQMLKMFFLTGKVSYVPPPAQDAKPRLRYGVAIAMGTIMTVVMKNPIYEILHLN